MTPYFIAFELMIYGLFILCLIDAWRGGPAVVWRLAAGVLFGILLEYGTIQQLHSYSYGQFMIMLGDVPLPIGVTWGCIVYSGRLFSESTRRSFTLYVLFVVLMLAGALLLVLLQRPRLVERATPAPATWVPLSFHAFFLVAGAISGIYFQVPALLIISLLMAFIGVYIHRDALQLPDSKGVFSSKQN